MEKRVLLAAVLSLIVVVVWFSLLGPQRPPAEPGPTPAGTPAAAETTTPLPLAPPEAAVAPSGPVRPAVSGRDGTDVTIKGADLQAVVKRFLPP